MATLELVVGGDVPALGTITVTNASSTTPIRTVEWGLEPPETYDPATSLLIDSDDMVTSGFAGAQSSATAGAYDPNASGNSTVLCFLGIIGQPVAACGTGNLSHVGSFRVKARVLTNTGTQVRLSYQAGDGPFTSNPWAENPYEARWVELDLGTISIPRALSGTQRWTGRIDVNPLQFTGGIAIDYLTLTPVSSGYGIATAPYLYSAGAIVGYDAFASTTAGNALNTRVASAGGTWATSGDATDFVFADQLNGGDAFDATESVRRSTSASETSGRFAILGSTNYTDSQVDVRVWSGGNNVEWGAILRWADSSNYLRLRAPMTTLYGGTETVYVEQVVAGVVTELAHATWLRNWLAPYRLRLIAFTSGRVIGQVLTDSGGPVASLDASSTALATGGTLATGKPGIRDRSMPSGSGGIRNYTAFAISTPTPEPVTIYPGRAMMIGSADVIREDSTGTYTGRPQSYNGSRFVIPPGTSRLCVRARYENPEAVFDVHTVPIMVQVNLTSRGLAVPRN